MRSLTALSLTRFREASSEYLRYNCAAVSKTLCISLYDIIFTVVFLPPTKCCFFSVGTCQQWTQLANTNYANGQWSPADSVLLCQSACYSNYACTGFDWVSTASPGQKCWLSGPWSGAQGAASGVTHYILNRSCPY